MTSRNGKGAQAGFTLVEVMVALLVISIGLLGIAKMQALALSSTGNARMRSIAAIEAASMAAMMHANRAYWASFTPSTVSVAVDVGKGTATVTGDSTLKAPSSGGCISTSSSTSNCSAANLAAVDLQNWTNALSQQLPPTATAAIACNAAKSGTPGTPYSCTVRLDWTENLVDVNTGMNASQSASQNVSALQSDANQTGAATHFILYVDP